MQKLAQGWCCSGFANHIWGTNKCIKQFLVWKGGLGVFKFHISTSTGVEGQSRISDALSGVDAAVIIMCHTFFLGGGGSD